VVIVAVAWLDDMLSHLLQSTLQTHKEASKRLFGTGGALDTLSARIDLATLLGVLSDEVRSDLHTLRDIRNEFAHHVADKSTHSVLTLSSEHIANKCRSFRCPAAKSMSVPRDQLLATFKSLAKDFEIAWLFGGRVHGLGQVCY
jgi:DNA-binding MltR family transcriptional regulator